MNAQEFDAKFDAGEEVFDQLDLANAKHSMQKHIRVNVDFPAWMLESLDKEANRIGATRQSIIKFGWHKS